MLLTTDEAYALVMSTGAQPINTKFVRDIEAAVIAAYEAKLREQNEPVAEVVSNHRAGMYDEFPIGTLLYANPAPIPEEDKK